MHPYAELALADLESARAETLPLYEQLAPEQWRRRIPAGEWTVRMLGAHVLSDRWPLEVLAPLVGHPERVPPTYGDRDPNEGNAWLQALDAALAPARILERAQGERATLRALMKQVTGDEPARVLYREFPTGYHDRMHRFDLERALEIECPVLAPAPAARPFFDRFKRNATLIYTLHQADFARLDEVANTGQTYREELMALAGGELYRQLCAWLGRPADLPPCPPTAGIDELIRRIEIWTDEARSVLAALDEATLRRREGQHSIAELLYQLLRQDQAQRECFRAINRRHTWARLAGLM